MKSSERNIAVFGAGWYGHLAHLEYGDRVQCFIDNDEAKKGTSYEGLPVISLDEYIKNPDAGQIIIAVKNFAPIRRQIENAGIQNFEIFAVTMSKRISLYPENAMIVNPYSGEIEEGSSEEGWNKKQENIDLVAYDSFVDYYSEKEEIFRAIEIETYNRCNGGCSFCPVSRGKDPRPETKMSEDLFRKIINELSSIDYDGRLSLFSNNEPFLDERIIEFHKYAREAVPHARIHLYTNGTLLTLDKYLEIIPYLDEIVIDNYNQELSLIPNAKKIEEYFHSHPELIKKTTIVLRKSQEILTSRGGEAPNRNNVIQYPENKCLYPFFQMIVRPDGKCSLCCNDPLGKMTLGDVNKNSLREIWGGSQYRNVRKQILAGRKNLENCRNCDNFFN